MLRIYNLKAGYGPLEVLKGVNLNVKKGEAIALIGLNGSGKSTVMKCIAGLVRPKGRILFKNKDITGNRPDEIVRIGISYVPQGRRVFQKMTVEENLEMGGFILKDKNLIKERIKEVYDNFPILKEKKDEKATFLSGGQQQMLSIGRALMLKPELLLLDEPSLGLAPDAMANVFKKIKEINQQGTTIIIVEQNVQMALSICDKSYTVKDGKITLGAKSHR